MTAGAAIGAETGSSWVMVIMVTSNCLEEWLWWFVYSRNLARWLQSGNGKTRQRNLSGRSLARHINKPKQL